MCEGRKNTSNNASLYSNIIIKVSSDILAITYFDVPITHVWSVNYYIQDYYWGCKYFFFIEVCFIIPYMSYFIQSYVPQ